MYYLLVLKKDGIDSLKTGYEESTLKLNSIDPLVALRRGEAGTEDLCVAVKEGDEVLVSILVLELVNPAVLDHNLMAPLHYAVLAKNESVARLLIKAGANIYQKYPGRNSPVELARITKDSSMLSVLLETEPGEYPHSAL